MLPIQKKLINFNYSSGNMIKYIVIHDTGNPSKGANAMAHYNYFSGGDRQASAHYFVDDSNIIQLIEDWNASWHCGDGGGKYGIDNHNSIGIEICINPDGNYTQAVANTVELTKYLMDKYSVTPDRVVRHYDASRKNCPASMSANNWQAWNNFKLKLLAPIAPKNPSPMLPLKGEAHVEGLGWMGRVEGEQIELGTEGKALRVEALTIDHDTVPILTKAHVQNMGWRAEVANGEVVGTMGKSLRIEAVQLTAVHPEFTIKYQAHVQNIGWMDWKNSGEVAGTIAQNLRLEKLRIKIVRK